VIRADLAGDATAPRVSNPTVGDPTASLDAWNHVRVRYPVDNPGTADTVPVPTTGYDAPFVEARNENNWSRTPIPFAPREHWAEFPDGTVAQGVSDRYALSLTRPDGTVLEIERLDAPVPVDPAHAAAERDRITRNFRGIDPAWRWRGGEVPATKPWYTAISPGEDGTLWVLRSTASIEEPDPTHDPSVPDPGPATRWVEPEPVADVFDPQGRYLGPVRLPRGFTTFRNPWLSAEAVVAVVTHELGHEQVVRFRLVPAHEVADR
jgi:hypothetical protein